MQSELRRVGCLTGDANGDWNDASQRSLTQFNRYAGTRLDTKVASVDTLDTIKQKPSRVCPLVCEHGFKADGDNCVKIVCAEGSFLNDDNECEKRRDKKPVATRKRDETRQQERPAMPRPQAGVGGGYGGGGGHGARRQPRRGPRGARRQAAVAARSIATTSVAVPSHAACHLGYSGGGGPGN